MGLRHGSGGSMGAVAFADVIRSEEVEGQRNPENPFVISDEEALFLGSAIFVMQELHSHIEPPPPGEYFRLHHLI